MSGEIVFHDVRDGAEVFRTKPTPWPSVVLASADWAGDDDAMWLVRDGTLMRIDLAAGGVESVRTPDLFEPDGPPVVRTSPDGKLVAFGASDARVYLRSADTGEQVAVLDGERSPVDGLEWLPDGSGLVSVDQSGTALVWDLTPPSVSPMHVSSMEYPATHAQFADGTVLLVGRTGAGVLVDASTGSTIAEFGLAEEFQDLGVVASEAAGTFVVPSDDGLRLYDVEERRWTREFLIDGIHRPLALSDDGTRLLAGTSSPSETDGSTAAVMIDTTTGDVLWRVERVLARTAVIVDEVTVVAGSRVSASTNQMLGFDTGTGEQLFTSSRSWTTDAMAVSPDGRHLATNRGSEGITTYDIVQLIENPTGQAVVASVPDLEIASTQLAYSSDGTVLFSGGLDGALRAFETATLEEQWSIDTGSSVSGLRIRDELLWFGVPVEVSGADGDDGGFELAAIPFDQESIAAWAASTVTRNLTDAECQEYLARRCAVRLDVS